MNGNKEGRDAHAVGSRARVREHRATRAEGGRGGLEAASDAQCVSPGRRLSEITTLHPRQPPGPAARDPYTPCRAALAVVYPLLRGGIARVNSRAKGRHVCTRVKNHP